MRISIFTLLPLLPLVLADGASIVNALSSIRASTAKLNNTVAPWTGNPLTLLPIIIDSASLLTTINSATKTASSSAPLSDLEAIGVAGATQALANDVNITLTTIIAKKSLFQKELLQGAILVNLLAEKSATDKFSSAVASKLSPELQDAAAALVKPIDDAFASAITAYESL